MTLFFTEIVSKFPPPADTEMENDVIYSPERYSAKLPLGVSRHKGSTGFVKVTWDVSIEPNAPASFIVSPMVGVLEFRDGQWNSSFYLQFPFRLAIDKKVEIFVKLLNVSGGAMLGNFTTVKITFPPNEVNSPFENNSNKNFALMTVFQYLGSALLIVGIVIVIAFLYRRHKKR